MIFRICLIFNQLGTAKEEGTLKKKGLHTEGHPTMTMSNKKSTNEEANGH